MPIRMTTSAVAIAINDTTATVDLTDADLKKFATTDVELSPLNMKFTPPIPADMTCTEAKLVAIDNPEEVYRFFTGVAVPLVDILDAIKPTESRSPISIKPFKREHGIRLELTLAAAPTAYTGNVIWTLSGRCLTPSS